MLWGNRFIKYKGKCLLFVNWIESGILYINDIITNNGNISETVILQKLISKRNWLAETNIIKLAIPTPWKEILKSDESINSNVNIKTAYPYGKNLDLRTLANKDIRSVLITKHFTSPYLHKFWETRLNQKINWHSLYFTIHKLIVNTKVRQLKYKILNRIIPTNENLFKWHIYNSPLPGSRNIRTLFLRMPVYRPILDVY